MTTHDAPPVDYDALIDYKSFYNRHVERLSGSGDNLSARCPFHEDRNASMTVNVKTGKYKCHSCAETGNAWTFLQKRLGMSEEQAQQHMRELAGVVDIASRRKSKAKITVEEYAALKHLPVSFLEALGLKNERGNIRIPYLDENGESQRARIRKPAGPGSRFIYGSGNAPIIPYGAWKLQALRDAGVTELTLVEGESDSQTLWHRGIDNVLGIPGSTMFKQEWVRTFLRDFDTLVLHIEPGNSGTQFRANTVDKLVRGGFQGTLLEFSVRGGKDPSELHVAHPDRFEEIWNASRAEAKPIDLNTLAPELSGTLPGAPVTLTMPDEFTVTQSGIVAQIETKSGPMTMRVSAVPILISKRLKSIDTGDEKIELAYQRDGDWKSITTKRSTAFNSRSIIELADHGLPITSERAKMIVKYLGDLEEANLGTLRVEQSVERMGWVGSESFLPGIASQITLDPPDGSESLAAAYHERGTLDEWKTAAGPVRDQWPLARFMLAAAFAAPMLKLLRQRVFIVHFWGASRGGKTAALKLALSAWGEPDELLATFNSTRVGMERLAGFYNDLPLGVDERQVIGEDQRLAEGLVYLLGAGKGKIRGAKGGGLQHTHTWRTIALTTGEEPLSRSSSHTGVKTRSLEIYGTPIGSEDLAQHVHQTVGDHYGTAGPEFVKRLIAHRRDGGLLDVEHEEIVAQLQQRAEGNLPSHVQAAATVCLADAYLSRWLFGIDAAPAIESAVALGVRMLGGLETTSDADYADRAIDWVQGWLAVNQNRFTKDEEREPWGFIITTHGDPAGSVGTVFVVPSIFEEALAKAGFASRRVLRDMAENSQIVATKDGDKNRYTKKITWQGRRVNMIGILALSGTVGREWDSSGTALFDLKGPEND